jgi:hypothetical protein
VNFSPIGVLFFTTSAAEPSTPNLSPLLQIQHYQLHTTFFPSLANFGTQDAPGIDVKRTTQIQDEVTPMAVSKKSIVKPAASKSTKAKAPKSTKSPLAAAGKMETTMRVARTALLARSIGQV